MSATSNVRITRRNRSDLTSSYVTLYRDGEPLDRLTPGGNDTLLLALLAIARDGRSAGRGPSLTDRRHQQIVRLAEKGEGEYVTEAGWVVTVTPDLPVEEVRQQYQVEHRGGLTGPEWKPLGLGGQARDLMHGRADRRRQAAPEEEVRVLVRTVTYGPWTEDTP